MLVLLIIVIKMIISLIKIMQIQCSFQVGCLDFMVVDIQCLNKNNRGHVTRPYSTMQ